jgi:hypothetical protein
MPWSLYPTGKNLGANRIGLVPEQIEGQNTHHQEQQRAFWLENRLEGDRQAAEK